MKSPKLMVSLLSLTVFILLTLPQVTPPALPQSLFDYNTLVQIQTRHEKAIMNVPGVLGIGITANARGPAFLVYVNEAEPRALQNLPSNLEGVPIEVMMGGEFVALAAPVSAQGPTGRFLPPVPMGVSTSNNQLCTAGTLGFVVHRSFNPSEVGYIASNHVASTDSSGCPCINNRVCIPLGTPQFQPGLLDTNCITNGTNIGTLADRVVLIPPNCPFAQCNNVVDAAYVRSSRSLVSPRIFGIGVPSTNVVPPDNLISFRPPFTVATLQKSGRTTGVTSGQVIAIHFSTPIRYPGFCEARFVEQILTQPIADFGDSGAPVLRGLDPVGIIVGKDINTNNTIVNPLAWVLSGLQVELDNALPTCQLSPSTDTNPVGTNHTVTVTVSQANEAISGVTVTFAVISGPNGGRGGQGFTGSDGRASFTYTSNGIPGTDIIRGSGTAWSESFSCTATKIWQALAPSCQLTPAQATNPVNTNHTVTVTVTQGGVPVSGVNVNFSVTSGPNRGVSGSRTTNTNGQASFTYTGSGGAGTDTIQASGTVSGQSYSCTATKTWVNSLTAMATAEPTIVTGGASRVSGTFTDTHFADGRFERFELGGGVLFAGIDLDWDTRQGQFPRLTVPITSVQSIDITMKIRNVDMSSALAGVSLFNYTFGSIELIGDTVNLPLGQWVTVTVTDTNPLEHLDIGGHYFIELGVAGSQVGLIDIDQFILVFHLR